MEIIFYGVAGIATIITLTFLTTFLKDFYGKRGYKHGDKGLANAFVINKAL